MSTAPQPGPRPRRDRTWPVVLGVFAAFWAAYLIFGQPAPIDDLDLPGPGTPVDYAWTLEDLDGNPVRFEQFRGKPLFVNIWATWCPPCVAEMPSIARLAAKPDFAEGQVGFICISTDDSLDDIRRFVAGKGWKMTILRTRKLPPVLMPDGLPATYFVSADGRLAYRRDGGGEWDEPQVVKKLRELAGLSS